jgi:hypothetical protein
LFGLQLTLGIEQICKIYGGGCALHVIAAAAKSTIFSVFEPVMSEGMLTSVENYRG